RGQQTFGRAFYVGPRFSITAAKCEEWIAVRPGHEAAIALAMLNVIASENLADPDIIDTGAIRELTVAYDAETVSQQSGISANKIRKISRAFAAAAGAVALAGAD